MCNISKKYSNLGKFVKKKNERKSSLLLIICKNFAWLSTTKNNFSKPTNGGTTTRRTDLEFYRSEYLFFNAGADLKLNYESHFGDGLGFVLPRTSCDWFKDHDLHVSLSSLQAAYIVYAADRCISLFSCDMVEVISALSAMTFGNHLTTLLWVNENSIKTFSDERDKKNIRGMWGCWPF